MEVADAEAALQRELAVTEAQRVTLRRELDEIFEAQSDVATDDEHDPEGATIAYERSRTMALLEQTITHLTEISLALCRLETGTYGICIRCGGPIAPERLTARPAVQTCIVCAR